MVSAAERRCLNIERWRKQYNNYLHLKPFFAFFFTNSNVNLIIKKKRHLWKILAVLVRYSSLLHFTLLLCGCVRGSCLGPAHSQISWEWKREKVSERRRTEAVWPQMTAKRVSFFKTKKLQAPLLCTYSSHLAPTFFFILPVALQAFSVLNLVGPEPFLAINRVSAWHVQIAHRSLRKCSFGNV